MDNKMRRRMMGLLGILLIALAISACTGKDQGAQDQSGSSAESAGSASESKDSTESSGEEGSADKSTEGNSEEAGNTAGDLEAYLREQDTIMADMMRDMEAVPSTGNASLSFVKGMIPHHESAVAMAESYLKNGGQNEELKKLAEDIIEVQKQEIEQMNTMEEAISDGGEKDEEKEAAYLKEYNKLFSSHHTEHVGHSTAKSVDEAFAEGMILHHQMAIDMAQALLPQADEGDVKELAQEIIDAQEKEIEQMQNILRELRGF